MKNYLIGALICLVVALAYGIKPVQRAINEAFNQGSLRGVENCMDYSKSELLSEDAVKASCVEAFHKRLYLPEVATGKAGPRVGQGIVGWEGILENHSADHVTTWIRIGVSIYDKDGKEQEVFAETPVWIDPMGEASFQVELPDLKPEQLDAIEYCDLDDESPRDCMAWGVADVMGLVI